MFLWAVRERDGGRSGQGERTGVRIVDKFTGQRNSKIS